MSWHPNTQQAVASKREASWRNFVKNDTYSAAADASWAIIFQMKCVAKHQRLSLDWQPRNPIFWLTFVMAISLYTPKQSKIDIVWHSTDDRNLGRVRIYQVDLVRSFMAIDSPSRFSSSIRVTGEVTAGSRSSPQQGTPVWSLQSEWRDTLFDLNGNDLFSSEILFI